MESNVFYQRKVIQRRKENFDSFRNSFEKNGEPEKRTYVKPIRAATRNSRTSRNSSLMGKI
ncbi:hypothetical protein DLM75_16325 [Leptospira stimsonii]|uniref:Uncharacterized protein n=1 Tax=Leptospira stimsonii TaxID=2202203 RepID=A0A396Z5H5_9LEPT|nr:hypothetical protein DLM75_16325 [Leptospira stimsonii]